MRRRVGSRLGGESGDRRNDERLTPSALGQSRRTDVGGVARAPSLGIALFLSREPLTPVWAARFGPRAGSWPERANLRRMASADKEAPK